MPRGPVKYLELLSVLSRHRVEFIVVGGVAAIVEGAPITTLDLDVVFERSPENLQRLHDALQSINARYRDPGGRHLVPDLDRLGTIETNLLLTELGPLDALTEIGDGWDYEYLIEYSNVRAVGDLRVRILNLGKVIESKEVANSDKDRAVLPVLRKTLEMKECDSGDE